MYVIDKTNAEEHAFIFHLLILTQEEFFMFKIILLCDKEQKELFYLKEWEMFQHFSYFYQHLLIFIIPLSEGNSFCHMRLNNAD